MSQPRGEPRGADLPACNPVGEVPVLPMDSGDLLTEFATILHCDRARAVLRPRQHRARTEVLRWSLPEPYSHAPRLAVMPYLRRLAGHPAAHAAEPERLRPHPPGATAARPAAAERPADRGPSIGELALYPGTRLAGEAGVEPDACPAVLAWLARVESPPRFLPACADAAREALSFEARFGGAAAAHGAKS